MQSRRECVSIVLPSYNGSKKIRNSIESVLGQTYSNWELILVDDCSEDSTGEVIDSYAKADTRIMAVHNKENQKLPRSLNIGFSKAMGAYRTWTSDDNTYHKDALAKMVEYLESNEQIDMVYADMNIVDASGRLLLESRRDEPDTLRFANPVGACFLYRTSIAGRIGEYDPDLFLAEDYEYWIRVFLQGKIGHLHEVLYDYGKTPKSLTATRKEEIQHQTFRARNMYKNELLAMCVTQKEKNRFYSEMIKLVPKKEEKKAIRHNYYRENASFLWGDLANRMKHFFYNHIGERS